MFPGRTTTRSRHSSWAITSMMILPVRLVRVRAAGHRLQEVRGREALRQELRLTTKLEVTTDVESPRGRPKIGPRDRCGCIAGFSPLFRQVRSATEFLRRRVYERQSVHRSTTHRMQKDQVIQKASSSGAVALALLARCERYRAVIP